MNEQRTAEQRYTCLKTVGPDMGGCGLVFGSWDELQAHEKTHSPLSSKTDLAFSMGNGQRKFTASADGDILRITIQDGTDQHEWYYLDQWEATKLRDLISGWLPPVETPAAPTARGIIAAFVEILNDDEKNRPGTDLYAAMETAKGFLLGAEKTPAAPGSPGELLGCKCIMCEFHRSAEAIERKRRAEKAPSPLDRDPAGTADFVREMAMLPNDSHPGAGCSCRECLRRWPENGKDSHGT